MNMAITLAASLTSVSFAILMVARAANYSHFSAAIGVVFYIAPGLYIVIRQ